MRCGQFRKHHTELRKIRRDKVSGTDFGYIDARKSFFDSFYEFAEVKPEG